ncbi:MAG: Uma2 family endonuclease [Myxococcales bacterium]|nr:Uma2 family endonuclease [Myxococcales bacterium]
MVALDGRARRKLRRDEYDRMVTAGMFHGEHVELVRGELVTMSPIGSAHSAVVRVLSERLVRAAPPDLMVSSQQPLACADESEPEPDLAIVARQPYRDAHPAAAALVIEVADTSIDDDLGAKAALYAESAVDEYWVIDLVRRVVVVHRDRAVGAWTSITTHAAEAAVAPVALPRPPLSLAELLRDA